MTSLTQVLEARLASGVAKHPPVGRIGIRTRPIRGGIEFLWADALGIGGYLCRCLNCELVEVAQKALSAVAKFQRAPLVEKPMPKVIHRRPKVTDKRAEKVWRKLVA